MSRSLAVLLCLPLLVTPALSAPSTCFDFTPAAELPPGPDPIFSKKYDATGYDYFSVYLVDRDGLQQKWVVYTYQGPYALAHLEGFASRAYTQADFIRYVPGLEQVLVTPAEWITRSPIMVSIANGSNVDPLVVWSAKICFGKISCSAAAAASTEGIVVSAVVLIAVVGALLLKRHRRGSLV